MRSPNRVVIEVEAEHPALLQGLEAWMQLGLLTERQVREISRHYLQCVVPEPAPTRDFMSPDLNVQPEPAPSEDLITRMLRSLKQELSVVWLLVLGVFLVVVSSAVLAASQWQNVSSAGQYLVLLGYTVAFWGASFWASRHPNLNLTASTLQTLTLLLIPVNFWAMDRFLLQSFQGSHVIITFVSAAILSSIAFLLLDRSPARLVLSYLGLSYLELGWSFVSIPFSIYLGSILLFVAPILTLRRFAIWGCAIALLFLRAIFVADVEIAQLGLAMGLCGVFVMRVAHRQSIPILGSLAGGLLALGWGVSVGQMPWQALAVSGLAVGVCFQSLRQFWRRFEVALLLAIGLQMIWLVWRLVPAALQVQLSDIAIRLTQTQTYSFAVLGILLFPYLLGILALSHWLSRRQQTELANFTTAIAVIFGALLLCISAPVASTRTLTLFTLTVTLGWVTRQRETKPFVYATHLGILATLTSAVDYAIPTWSISQQAGLFLGIAIAELSICAIGNWTIWRQSSWYLGLGAASLAYVLWLSNYPVASWATSWLLVPLSLTAVATKREERQELAIRISAIALGIAQLITLQRPESGLFGLVVAGLLMAANTHLLTRRALAAATIGFSLASIGWGLWHWLPGMQQVDALLLFGAVSLAVLEVGARWGRRLLNRWSIYVTEAEAWAQVLSVTMLVGTGIQVLRIYNGEIAPTGLGFGAILLTTLGLAIWTWRSTSVARLIGLGVGIELLIIYGLSEWNLLR